MRLVVDDAARRCAPAAADLTGAARPGRRARPAGSAPTRRCRSPTPAPAARRRSRACSSTWSAPPSTPRAQTDGAVDPTLGRAMQRIGYDRDIAARRAATARRGRHAVSRVAAPRWRAVRLRPRGRAADRPGRHARSTSAPRPRPRPPTSRPARWPPLRHRRAGRARRRPRRRRRPPGRLVHPGRRARGRRRAAGAACATAAWPPRRPRVRRWQRGGAADAPHRRPAHRPPGRRAVAHRVGRRAERAAPPTSPAPPRSCSAPTPSTGSTAAASPPGWSTATARCTTTAGWPAPRDVAARAGGGVMTLWYTARGAGLSALVLLTLVDLRSARSCAAPRPAAAVGRASSLQYVHRAARRRSALGVLVLHVVTILADSYAHVGVTGAIVPFTSGYRADLGRARHARGLHASCSSRCSASPAAGWPASPRGARVWRGAARPRLRAAGRWRCCTASRPAPTAASAGCAALYVACSSRLGRRPLVGCARSVAGRPSTGPSRRPPAPHPSGRSVPMTATARAARPRDRTPPARVGDRRAAAAGRARPATRALDCAGAPGDPRRRCPAADLTRLLAHARRRLGWPDAAAPASRSPPSCARCARARAASSSTAARASRPATRTARCCAAPRTSCSTARSPSRPRVGAREVTVAVHDEPRPPRCAARVAERPRRAAACGSARSAAGSSPARPARVVRGARRRPGAAARTPRRTPTANGTLVANAETFAQVAVLLRLGPHRFAATGTRDEPGTTLLTVGGAVGRPGVVEIPLGTPLGIVLAAGRRRRRRRRWSPAATTAAGSRRSRRSGSRAPGWPRPAARSAPACCSSLDQRTCALGELARVTGWLAARVGPAVRAVPVRAARPGRRRRRALPRRPARPSTPRSATPAPSPAAAPARTPTAPPASSPPALHLLHDETDAHLRTAAAAGRCSASCRSEAAR